MSSTSSAISTVFSQLQARRKLIKQVSQIMDHAIYLQCPWLFLDSAIIGVEERVYLLGYHRSFSDLTFWGYGEQSRKLMNFSLSKFDLTTESMERWYETLGEFSIKRKSAIMKQTCAELIEFGHSGAAQLKIELKGKEFIIDMRKYNSLLPHKAILPSKVKHIWFFDLITPDKTVLVFTAPEVFVTESFPGYILT